jgi:hypothetical protein
MQYQTDLTNPHSMKHTYLTLSFCFLLFTPAFLLSQCPEGFLLNSEYSVSESTVFYGSNTTVLGDTVELLMDIYEPEEDSLTARPVLILAFGGSFTSGSRDDLIMPTLCRQYAAKGWVAASIDYRLFPAELGSPDSLELIDANMKAVSDMKAAVRHFRQMASEDNPYRVNPEFIVVGGYSAGAFTGIHAAVIDEDDELPPSLEQIILNNGGLNGNTGSAENQSYSSEVQAVLSFSGAVFDTLLIGPNDPPIASLHGLADQTVPVDRGRAVGTVTTFGSRLLRQRADNIGLPNFFTPIPGAGHIDFWFPFLYIASKEAFFLGSDSFFRDLYCDQITQLEPVPSPVAEIQLYPNPAHHEFRIQGKNIQGYQSKYVIFNSQGQVVSEGPLNSSQHRINVSSFSPGIYWVKVDNGAPQPLTVVR